jgi:curved DNA-binding protein CbpA
VLGVTATATRAEILSEYRRLMQTVHPDRGGTNYLASRVNEARDVLLASKLED